MAAEGKSTISLAGTDGNALLSQITNNTTSNSSLSSSMNISMNASGVSLGGVDAGIQFQELVNASNNLSDWGSEPPAAPSAPEYDAQAVQTYYVLRLNHAGY